MKNNRNGHQLRSWRINAGLAAALSLCLPPLRALAETGAAPETQSASRPQPASATAAVWHVEDFGAIADGKTKNETKLVTVEGALEPPVRDLLIENVTGTCTEPRRMKNARGVTVRDLHVTGLTKPLLVLENVEGTSLETFLDR